MARTKNALRGHFIAAVDTTDPTKEPTTYLELAASISSVKDSTDEKTDDSGYYDGDGTPEEVVLSVKGSYDFEGLFDPQDPAQALIAAMKYKVGNDRHVWHKVVDSDGKHSRSQIANVSKIVAGEGDATEYEVFKATISWIKTPVEKSINITG